LLLVSTLVAIAVEDIPEAIFRFEAVELLVTAILLVTGTTPERFIDPLVAANARVTGRVKVKVIKIVNLFMLPP
jgi:hypothetical protein